MADKKIRGNFPASEGMAQVDTIADLKALVETNVDSVTVLGYHSVGDMEARVAQFDSASTLSDNGGTIIIPTYSGFGGTGRWLFNSAILNFRMFGAKGDGSTTDSAAMQAAITATPTNGVLEGTPGDIYFGSELTVSKSITIQGNNCTFKHKGNVALQNQLNWNDWLSPFTAHSTGQETLLTIAADNVTIRDVIVDGNGILFINSAGYANSMVKMFAVESAKHVMFDNVHIADNNGMGVFVYASEYVTFQNGSITNTRGLTGSITSHEQILFIASRYCKAINSEFGGTTPWSCIAAVGGFVPIADGSEVGGFIPFNTDTVDLTYIHFGRPTGDTDTFHEIIGNVCRSDVLDANEAGGGGVLGRVITMNCGQPIIKDNIVYDTTNLSQGGIGLGHDDQPTPGDIVYARNSSRATVSGNTVFGFRKSGQGIGILSIDAEDVNVHDNIVYNCNTGIIHDRFATNSRYTSNYLLFNDIAIALLDVAGALKSHGLYSSITIDSNNCVNNLQDVVTLNNTTYVDLTITNNQFIQSSDAVDQIQIDLVHGVLVFNNNRIVNRSTGIVGDFFNKGIGTHVECSNNVVECLVASTSDLFFFDGSFDDVIGRGRLVINGLSVDCPVGGSDNRRVQIRRLNTKECTVSNLHFTNCSLTIQTSSGHVKISDGIIETQGTATPVSLNVTTTASPKTIFMSGFLFPSFGSTTAIITGLASGAGSIIVSDCVTQENKEITDRSNGNQMRNNDCWKTTAGVLTTSRP